MSEDVTLDEFAKSDGKEPSEFVDEGLREEGFLTLPHDWDISTVREVSKEGGLVDGDWIESADMDESGAIQLVQLGHIGEGRFKGKPNRFITKEFAEQEDCTVLSEGDLLISRMQEPILRSCILPSFEQDSVMAVDIARLQEDENWNRMLLKYIFNSRPIWKQGIAWASGTTRKRISRKNIEKLRLPTPPLSEQRQIATVLHTVDQAIQKTGEIIEQTKSVRQGLKQDLLTGQKRSNEYKYVNLEPAEVKMPFEWDVVSLSHVTNNITEMPHRMPEKVEEGIPFITTGDISEDADIDLDSVERISEEDYRELSKSFDAEQGDILYTRYGTIGIAKEVDFNPKFIASYSVALLKPNQEVDPTFLTIQLNSWLSQKQAASRTTQSANKNFDLERIPKLNIVLPDKESQIEIARIISEVNGTISENKKYLQQLKRLKRGLMQDLLSGEVRTTDVDIDVPQEVAKYA